MDIISYICLIISAYNDFFEDNSYRQFKAIKSKKRQFIISNAEFLDFNCSIVN